MDMARIENRKKIINEIRSDANNARKQWSWRAGEVQQGRCQQFVKEQLEGMFNVESVKEMPIINSINIQKRIVERKATVYKEPPKRNFGEVTPEKEEILKLIYRDGKFNQKLNRCNKDLIYQDQTIGMIYPCSREKKLKMRVLKMHQIDAIASKTDPEMSDGFIISVFDREYYEQTYQDKEQKDTATGVVGRSVRSSASAIDGENSKLSNEYQYKKYVEQFLVWTRDYNFMMNGLGEVIDMLTGEPLVDQGVDSIVSPLKSYGIMPFFEVSREKDYEFFVRSGYPLTDFTIEFNRALSDLQNNIKMNGYSIAVLKAPSELQPQSQVVGASMLLKLPTDDPEKEIDFSFASPQSSIGEISAANDQMLNYFVSSMGEDRGAINSTGDGEKSTSGIDRFIQMVDRLHASKDDYELFRDAENQIYEIVKAWVDVLSGSDQLGKKYWVNNIPVDSQIAVEYHKPEMIQTESEKVDIQSKRKELGTASRVDFLMEDKKLSREDAIEEIIRIDQDELLGGFNGQAIRQEQNIQG